jgi:hypothetical protein
MRFAITHNYTVLLINACRGLYLHHLLTAAGRRATAHALRIIPGWGLSAKENQMVSERYLLEPKFCEMKRKAVAAGDYRCAKLTQRTELSSNWLGIFTTTSESGALALFQVRAL